MILDIILENISASWKMEINVTSNSQATVTKPTKKTVSYDDDNFPIWWIEFAGNVVSEVTAVEVLILSPLMPCINNTVYKFPNWIAISSTCGWLFTRT